MRTDIDLAAYIWAPQHSSKTAQSLRPDMLKFPIRRILKIERMAGNGYARLQKRKIWTKTADYFFCDRLGRGAVAGTEARDFAQTSKHPLSKEAIRQAAMAGNALVIKAGPFRNATSQLQLLKFDKRAPEMQAASEAAPSYHLIAEKTQEVIECGAKLDYYGPPPKYPRMRG